MSFVDRNEPHFKAIVDTSNIALQLGVETIDNQVVPSGRI